jgi:hypothetical protein
MRTRLLRRCVFPTAIKFGMKKSEHFSFLLRRFGYHVRFALIASEMGYIVEYLASAANVKFPSLTGAFSREVPAPVI